MVGLVISGSTISGIALASIVSILALSALAWDYSQDYESRMELGAEVDDIRADILEVASDIAPTSTYSDAVDSICYRLDSVAHILDVRAEMVRQTSTRLQDRIVLDICDDLDSIAQSLQDGADSVRESSTRLHIEYQRNVDTIRRRVVTRLAQCAIATYGAAHTARKATIDPTYLRLAKIHSTKAKDRITTVARHVWRAFRPARETWARYQYVSAVGIVGWVGWHGPLIA